jgi:hypothetical protein
MLVLSGVFNARILDATNYANQDYMCAIYHVYWSTRVLASIGAVVEMGVLSTLKRLLMESSLDGEFHCFSNTMSNDMIEVLQVGLYFDRSCERKSPSHDFMVFNLI